MTDFDTVAVVDMDSMFSGCIKLITTLTLAHEPTSYDGIFYNCSTESDSSFTLNYTDGLQEVAQAMVASANNPNIKLGELKQ